MTRVVDTFRDLYHERTNFQIVTHSRRWLIVSMVLILVSLGALYVRGLNFGIDFTGGTSWDVSVEGDVPSVDAVRSQLEQFGIADAKISFRTDRASGSTNVLVQASELESDQTAEVRQTLSAYGDVSVQDTSATWGESITRQAWQALIVFFVLVTLYFAWRFEWRMAIAAMAALAHDIIVTVGFYAITGAEVGPATVTAFLTILGFSLYDTVVVFDRIRENAENLGADANETYSDMANRSLNQVLARSLNTSLMAALPVVSLLVVGVWIFGAISLQAFALVLLIGVIVGAYSSIFVATPLAAWLNERRPAHRERADAVATRRARQAARGVTAGVADSGALAAAERAALDDRPDDGDADDEDDAPPRSGRPSGTPPADGTVVPRPRRQRRRKRR